MLGGTGGGLGGVAGTGAEAGGFAAARFVAAAGAATAGVLAAAAEGVVTAGVAGLAFGSGTQENQFPGLRMLPAAHFGKQLHAGVLS